MTNREHLGLNTATEIMDFVTKYTSSMCSDCPAYDKSNSLCKSYFLTKSGLCRDKLTIWLDEEYHDELAEFVKENKNKIIAVKKRF